MSNERINIGTYPKPIAYCMKGEILRWAKHRGQKVKVFFKGRGKGSNGSGCYRKTPKVAIYIEVYLNEEILGYSLKERVITQAVKHCRQYVHLDTLLRLGFKGFKHCSEPELIEELISLLEQKERGE